MKMFLFCVMLLTVIFCHAQHVSKFSRNDTSWVKECQGERVYLNSHNLVVSNEGIFLVYDTHQKIPLSLLCSDAQGIYTLSEALEYDLAVVAYPVWCRTCMAWRVIGLGGRCGACSNIP